MASNTPSSAGDGAEERGGTFQCDERRRLTGESNGAGVDVDVVAGIFDLLNGVTGQAMIQRRNVNVVNE